MSTVVIVTNATVSFTSVYILLAAKTTVLLQEQSQITFFFFFLKNIPCENQNNMLSYTCNIKFIESVQDFFAIFFHSYSERVGVHVFVPKFISLS